MTEAEFSQRYLSSKLKKPALTPNTERHGVKGRPHMVGAGNLPENVDWFKAGKVSESVD